MPNARRSRPARALPALALSAAALLAGCGSTSRPHTASSTTQRSSAPKIAPLTTPKYVEPKSSEPIRSGVVNVAYRDITIHPDVLRVRVGTTVRWTNYDPVAHNVSSTSGPQRFSSGNFGMGASFEVTLTRPGVIHYECTLEPATMNGTIEVV